ncbi:MAG TPA: poly-gamma-glutamate hydrolase family protein [Acidimicrobiales bacterium]|nr:poly-gamma-glutamate hydrolase family protein [Acidimicrobiales bacterium]
MLAEPGVEEVLALRSRVGFLAFHGGSLERMTDIVAIDAAERSGASVYAVVQPPGLRWHIRSVDVKPDASQALASFVEHVDVAIAIHGFGREGFWTSLLLGGSNRELARHVGTHLRASLPDYSILDDLEDVPVELRGLHPRNPVNLPRGGGVQIELPPRVRGTTPHWDGWEGPGHCPPLEALVAGLATAVQTWSP